MQKRLGVRILGPGLAEFADARQGVGIFLQCVAAFNQHALRLFALGMLGVTAQKGLQLRQSQVVELALHQTQGILKKLLRIFGLPLDLALGGQRRGKKNAGQQQQSQKQHCACRRAETLEAFAVLANQRASSGARVENATFQISALRQISSTLITS